MYKNKERKQITSTKNRNCDFEYLLFESLDKLDAQQILATPLPVRCLFVSGVSTLTFHGCGFSADVDNADERTRWCLRIRP